MWVWNLVSHIKGEKKVEGVREQSAREDIWAKGGGSNRATAMICSVQTILSG